MAVVLLAAIPVAGQAPTVAAKTKPTVAAKTWTQPRTPDGQPDLQGTWENATTTPLERPNTLAGKQVLTEEERAALDAQVAESRSTDRRDGTPDEDLNRAYNDFWWDRGKSIGRTSLIVDPPDGRMPPLTPEGQKRLASFGGFSGRGGADSWLDRSLPERCLVYRPVPPIPTGYNNNYEIVQGPGYVAILQEEIHEVRMIPIDARPHLPPGIRQWLGDSRGRWEGNTLVVDTTNFTDKTNFRGSGANLHVVERFTRVDANTIDYQFTVDDPTVWARPWTAAIPWRKSQGQLYEYACHEGNYSMFGILNGARAEEKAAEDAKKSSK